MRRHAKGVRLIRLDEKQTLSTIVAFEETENDEESTETPVVEKQTTVVEVKEETKKN